MKREYQRIAFCCLVSIVLLLLITIFQCSVFDSGYDVIIRNGRIVDGTGNPAYRADVGIKNGKIAQIGRMAAAKAKRIIEADGSIVAPGFVDVHTHVDRDIAEKPAVMNYLRQGVTTVVGGNCGGSEYPLEDLFAQLENNGIAINFASLIGHNTIRREVMGSSDRAPTDKDLSGMQSLVRQEMEAGAIGFSTGLGYVPGRYSTTEEIIDLVKAIHPYGGIYATHMRHQGTRIEEGIRESIRIGREAGVPVQISHIKLATEDVWGKFDLITDPIQKAHQEGMEVYLDQYPYTATSSGFASSFPGWALSGGNDSLVIRLEDPEDYRKIKAHIIERRLKSERGIDKLKTIYVSGNDNHKEYEGKNLAEILDLLGRKKTVSNGADLIIEMQKTDRPRGVFFQMDEYDVEALMNIPYNMIGSDGGIQTPGEGVPHPRSYGTFPRVLGRYVREWGALALPDAVRKMTSLPAQAMGFHERGVLKPGMIADIVVFDPDAIIDTATFPEPHQYPEGVSFVVVNGEVAVEAGEWTGALSGIVLYGHGNK